MAAAALRHSTHAEFTRRDAVASLAMLSTTAPPAYASTELEVFDYFSPLRFAVKKQRQKQEQCFEAEECIDTQPYYAIECARDDTECLQRKRRLASQEFNSFKLDPTSSPIFLFATLAFVFQWGAAAVRIGTGLMRRALGEYSDEGEQG
eukprot:CAMPEP_0183356844 /NCGR_PEP_ID=MMETSP0164_2-20130417/45227_1 /TAXON_ID=221442 /ORGANISM="Coccolithus pelagicus ssp braarudi, Strain PLY182g" /LENGTH=148 /DNA_ID=CAMNT_0025530347 /DNA_START=42 /DNA_END=488 /DNA_ORIENTATION=-